MGEQRGTDRRLCDGVGPGIDFAGGKRCGSERTGLLWGFGGEKLWAGDGGAATPVKCKKACCFALADTNAKRQAPRSRNGKRLAAYQRILLQLIIAHFDLADKIELAIGPLHVHQPASRS